MHAHVNCVWDEECMLPLGLPGELYELLNNTVVSSGFDMPELYESLAAIADECRNAIEGPFVAFLGTPRCSQLFKRLREAKSYLKGPHLKGPRLPLTDVKGIGLVGTMAAYPVEQAVSLVDVMVPGLPLVYVNEAWEELTGYTREEVLGHNCRLLQGVATEEIAISQIVQAIREGRRTHVCVSNYKKDGTRFRNSLSLHPLFDERGDFRYVVGVAVSVLAAKCRIGVWR